MSYFKINLHEAVYSLSDALDLVGVTHIHHGKRVAYIAAECAKLAGWPSRHLDDLFQAAILHDCGVSKTLVHSRLAQFEWENEAEHCHVGAKLMKSCSLLSKLSDVILYHHTHWDGLKEIDLPFERKMTANCIYMADRVDIVCLTSQATEPNLLLSKEIVRAKIQENRGTMFSPEWVDLFLEISESEAFWFALEHDHIQGYVSQWMFNSAEVDVPFEDLRDLVRVFSRIVDAKSTFTREHSDGVASLARFIGHLFNLPLRSCEMLELAGLLHDLGKLRVPDQLLEKAGKLSAEEYANVQRHSFDTYNILKNIHGMEDIALWAGQHHERMDGSGYPYHQGKSKLSLESRIVAVADVFQALAQNRPYRGPMTPLEILGQLKIEVSSGKLDADVVHMVESNLHSCHVASLPDCDY